MVLVFESLRHCLPDSHAHLNVPPSLVTVQTAPTHFVPPLALILMCSAVIPLSRHRAATSWAANIAAYGLACRLTHQPQDRENVSTIPMEQHNTTTAQRTHRTMSHLISVSFDLHSSRHTGNGLTTHQDTTPQ